MSLRGLAIRIAPVRTTIMTIHIVRIVELMLGWNVMRSFAPGALSGAKSHTTWGAGNSRVPSMKQAGYGHSWPASPSLGNGGKRMNAAMLATITAPTMRNQRCESPRLAGGDGASG